MTLASTVSPAASSQLIETTLRAAAGATGMQLVFVSEIEAQTFTWRAVQGTLRGISAGQSQPLHETFCSRLLTGAPASTSNAASDPAYADVHLHTSLGVTAYVGVPLRHGGVVTGTLGGLDVTTVSTSEESLRILGALGRIVSAESSRDPEVRLRRTTAGWEVEQASVGLTGTLSGLEDLTVAMSLADLFAAEAGDTVPPQRPRRAGEELSEAERLRVQINQLEHALSARVVIEQAIGVVAQRFSLTPREAFDRLRKAARSRGQRVHDLSVSIVRSTSDASVTLPETLR